jgi:hypothetical protein
LNDKFSSRKERVFASSFTQVLCLFPQSVTQDCAMNALKDVGECLAHCSIGRNELKL